jgi:hypothetical protein
MAGRRGRIAPTQPARAPARTPYNAFARPSGGGAYLQQAAYDDYSPNVFVPSHYQGRQSATRGYQKGAGKAAPRAPPQMSMEQISGNVHEAIYPQVWEAVQKIMHLEETHEEKNLVKRIVKYMHKAACDETLVTLEWDKMCRHLAKNMFTQSGYTSLGECEWFFTIDLTQALLSAALVLLPAAGWRVPPQQAQYEISQAYHAQLDRITLEKALWEMCENLYGDDEKVRTKVYNAMIRSYEPAVEKVLNDMTPMDEIERVQIFTKAWIEDATCRAWGGLHDQAEEVLNHENLVNMFDHLLRPFGEDHEFSAIPRVLCAEHGPPPPGWDFLPQVVEDLFTQWANSDAMPSRKRKKKATEDDAEFDALFDEEVEEPVQPVKTKPVAKKTSAKKKVKTESTGHPSCTSGADCAGSLENGLVQHILEEGPGDLYCDVCWTSFTERNPDLEGVPVEE